MSIYPDGFNSRAFFAGLAKQDQMQEAMRPVETAVKAAHKAAVTAFRSALMDFQKQSGIHVAQADIDSGADYVQTALGDAMYTAVSAYLEGHNITGETIELYDVEV